MEISTETETCPLVVPIWGGGQREAKRKPKPNHGGPSLTTKTGFLVQFQMAMGQKPRLLSSEHPIQSNHFEIGSKMGGEFPYQPKWDPVGFEPWPLVCGFLLLRFGGNHWLLGCSEGQPHLPAAISPAVQVQVQTTRANHQLGAAGSVGVLGA